MQKKFGGPFILRECTHMFQNQTEKKFLNIFLGCKGKMFFQETSGKEKNGIKMRSYKYLLYIWNLC